MTHHPQRSGCWDPLPSSPEPGAPLSPLHTQSCSRSTSKPPGAASPRQEKGRALPSKIPAHAFGRRQQGSLLGNRMLKATRLIPKVQFYPQNTQEPHSPSTERGLRRCPPREACTPCQAAGWLHTNSGCLQKARGGSSPCRALGPQSPLLIPGLATGSRFTPHTP